ncbi:MAG: DUF3299 domain-containing protein [Verrucomicrobiota bacterium]|jgi:hypothetical protein
MKTPKNNPLLQVFWPCFVAGALAASLRAQPAAPKPASPVGPAGGSPSAETSANAPAASAKKDDFLIADFSKLAGFTYVVSDTPLTNQVPGADVSDKQIPDDVKALNLKKVTITGFMMPLREKGDKSTEFLIMRTQSSCCFGIAPAITELVTVKAAAGVPTIMDELVQIQGTLHVGTVREDGYIVGIYQMDDGKFIGRANK